MKIRKFRAGDMVESASDSEEDKAKTAGLAASNAEKKSSGFLGLGRLFQGNIDEKGSEAYNKYGAGYGRKIEAENDRLKAATLKDTAAPAETKPAAPAASAPAASANLTKRDGREEDKARPVVKPFGSGPPDTRLLGNKSTTTTKVVEDMPKTRPEGGAQVATGDARVAEYANAFPSNRDEGVRAAKRGQGSAAAKTTSPTQRGGREEDKAVPKAPADLRTAEAGNSRGSRAPAPADLRTAEAGNSRGSRTPAPAGSRQAEAGNSRGSRAPEAAAKAPAPAGARASAEQKNEDSYADDTTLSFADRRKRAEMRAKRGSTTDTRSVNERFKDRFKAGGGAIRGYASGGSVSASSRGDGIAQRGKTRGKMC